MIVSLCASLGAVLAALPPPAPAAELRLLRGGPVYVSASKPEAVRCAVKDL
jgi:hypothetical protein